MPTEPLRVDVQLGQRSYPIEIGSGLLRAAGPIFARLVSAPRVFVLSDSNVAPLYLNQLADALKPAGLTLVQRIVPAGEATKSFGELEAGLDWLIAEGATRGDILVALGGGVIGDLAGLMAALMKRGMGLVQIPTTLLAQVDSSVGGKTAVNTRHGKNLIGAFHQPRLVLIDTDVLATLPSREMAAGYAEIVKYGVLGDADFFAWLETHGESVMAQDSGALQTAIARSCQAKATIVAQDEREGGVRALLNLGHTFGHALEAENGFGPGLLHGEAVACGMALALRYSQRLGLIDAAAIDRTVALLHKADLATDISALGGGPYGDAERLVEHMKQDKKARGHKVPLILARQLGQAFIHPQADLNDVGQFLAHEITR